MDDCGATRDADPTNDVESTATSELLNLNARVSAFVTCPASSDAQYSDGANYVYRDNKGAADALSIQDGGSVAKAGYTGLKADRRGRALLPLDERFAGRNPVDRHVLDEGLEPLGAQFHPGVF